MSDNHIAEPKNGNTELNSPQASPSKPRPGAENLVSARERGLEVCLRNCGRNIQVVIPCTTMMWTLQASLQLRLPLNLPAVGSIKNLELQKVYLPIRLWKGEFT